MSVHTTALYYPHMAIENVNLLKNMLFLWDSIELICPFGTLPYRSTDPHRQHALELLGRPIFPTDEERRAAHDAIVELAQSDLPDWFFPANVTDRLRYAIFPEKFLPETWDALQRTNLARPKTVDVDPPMSASSLFELSEKARHDAYETTQAFGITMLSILADCCAADSKQLITDEASSYLALDRYFRTVGGAKPTRWKKSRHERLVTISLLTADVSHVNLPSLLRLRRQENSRPELRAMRHNYLNKLHQYSERLRTEARSRRDIQEIERMFRNDVSDDIALLKEELKDEAKKLFFSTEVATAAIALPGIFVHPVAAVVPAAALYRLAV